MTELEIKKLVDVESERLTNSLTKDLMPPTYKCWIDNLIKMYEKGIKDANRINNTIDEDNLDELAHKHCLNNGYSGLDENEYIEPGTEKWGDVMYDIEEAYKAGYKTGEEQGVKKFCDLVFSIWNDDIPIYELLERYKKK